MRIILATIALTVTAWSQSVLPQIAVAEIHLDSTIKDLESVALAERLSAELAATKAFRVLERREVGTILAEQGFQQTGACEESQCQVEMGRLLGVESLVSGSVARSGNAYSVSVRMISVTTGELQTSVSTDVYGGGSKVMGTYLAHIAKKLANQEYAIPKSKPSRLWWWVGGSVVAVAGGLWTFWYLNEAPPRQVTRQPEIVGVAP